MCDGFGRFYALHGCCRTCGEKRNHCRYLSPWFDPRSGSVDQAPDAVQTSDRGAAHYRRVVDRASDDDSSIASGSVVKGEITGTPLEEVVSKEKELDKRLFELAEVLAM